MNVLPVVILSAGATPSEERARKMAEFLGLDVLRVALRPDIVGVRAIVEQSVPRCTSLLLDVETIAAAEAATPGASIELREVVCGIAREVCVFGFRPIEQHEVILRDWSAGQLTGVRPLSGGSVRFRVSGEFRTACGPFSGLTFLASPAGIEHVFVEEGRESGVNSLVHADESPFVVGIGGCGSGRMFFLASRELADLDAPVGRDADSLSWFSSLAPLMMCLRNALGDRIWHNESPRACLIIDDPLLQDRYGFLQYRQLIASMNRARFSACIAFIPWNYRRSAPGVAALVSSRKNALGICVHGCDHTRGEFAATDIDALRARADLALERMRAHHNLSGVPFDEVMVFPQGLFSVEALRALKAAGYLAAVNTDPHPSAGSRALTLRDLIDVAVTSLGDLPLFSRRYPRNIAAFAFDLFLGKPALAVEHHGYFRNGYAQLETFVDALNQLEPRLEWTTIGAICGRSSLMRLSEEGDVHVRFYTGRFRLCNDSAASRRYVLEYAAKSGGQPPAMTIDGALHKGSTCVVTLDAGHTAEICILGVQDPSLPSTRPDASRRTGSPRLRRHLSEFRDNYVDTSRLLSALATIARNVRGSRRDAASR